jgi:hypothetical protein
MRGALCIVLLVPAFLQPPAQAQSRLKQLDPAAVTEAERNALSSAGESRSLSCIMIRQKPEMHLDLSFHTSYTVTVPLQDLSEGVERLRVVARVTPEEQPEKPAYLAVDIPVPALDPGARGNIDLPGEFRLGPGRYRVDWMLDDGKGRACTERWDLRAKLDNEFENVMLSLPPGSVAEAPEDGFAQVAGTGEGQLRLKVLVNFAPGSPDDSVLTADDARALTSIVAAVSRLPGIGRISVAALSTSQEQVLYRQNEAASIDFPALGKALRSLQSGTVSFAQLADKKSAGRFLTSVLEENLAAGEAPPDAVVIVSPLVMLDEKLPEDPLASLERPTIPIFYLNYVPDPRRHPWRDTLTSVLKVFRGLRYSITRPNDLGSALRDMQTRLAPPM